MPAKHLIGLGPGKRSTDIAISKLPKNHAKCDGVYCSEIFLKRQVERGPILKQQKSHRSRCIHLNFLKARWFDALKPITINVGDALIQI